MSAYCQQENIAYEGFHYQAIHSFSQPVNHERAQFQLNYLVENKQWLSDEQADKLMSEQR